MAQLGRKLLNIFASRTEISFYKQKKLHRGDRFIIIILFSNRMKISIYNIKNKKAYCEPEKKLALLQKEDMDIKLWFAKIMKVKETQKREDINLT